MKVLIKDIEYETDGESVDLPSQLLFEADADEEDIESLASDYISNLTGFLHNGFNIIYKNPSIKK